MNRYIGMSTAYAMCGFAASLIAPYSKGKMPPPITPIINNAEPALVNLPSPFNESGQIAGHNNALPKPRKAINQTEAGPLINKATTVKRIPTVAESIKAFLCCINLGIVKIPMQ